MTVPTFLMHVIAVTLDPHVSIVYLLLGFFADRLVVAIAGRAAEFARLGDEGGRVIYGFCPDCGTTVHYRIDSEPGLVAIPAGAFADPSFPPPFLSFYHDSRRCPWVELRAAPLQTFG